MNRKKRKTTRKWKSSRISVINTWKPPVDQDCIVFLGADKNGNHAVDSISTQRQIDYLMSKNSRIDRNGNIVCLDAISLKIRKPHTLEQHQHEYGTSIAPFLFSNNGQHVIHPEEFKNDIQALYGSELYTTSLLDYIRDDRLLRVDKNSIVSDMPPIIVVTIRDNSIVRVEFYMGHNKLAKRLDLRSNDLTDKALDDSYVPTHSYDVDKNEYWLASTLGMRLSDFKIMHDTAHEALFVDYCKITFGKCNLRKAS